MNWRRLLSYLRPFIPIIIVGLLASFSNSALSLVFPRVIGDVVDSVLNVGNTAQLDQITMLLLGVFFIRAITTFIETLCLQYVGERIVYNLRLQVYSHLQTLSLGFFSQRRTGELMSRLSNDVTGIQSALTTSLNIGVQQALIFLGSIIVMVAINWRLTLFILALIPILIPVGFGFGMILRRLSSKVNDEIAGVFAIVSEVLTSIREVKSFVREPFE
ncbi:MAG: ABC transporter ATP-binding protein, partial [Phototrophicales bacterium]